MRVGVIGLGSMGKRRVRDLSNLGHEVVGFDLREDRREEATRLFSICTASDRERFFSRRLDAVVISTPPDQHVTYYEACFEHHVPFFSEANIFTPRPEWFTAHQNTSGVQSYPSGSWLFHPLFRTLKDHVDRLSAQRLNTVNYHYGGFLPLWHPGEKYTDFYAGRRQTSAAREMVPFEMEALVWLFGSVRAVSAFHGKRRKWDSDIDDTYGVHIEFNNGVWGSLCVELHQVQPFRILRLSAQEESFLLDLRNHELDWYRRESDSSQKVRPAGLQALSSFNFEDIYREEIRAFLGALSGKPYPKTWEIDRHLSDILFAAELSTRRKAWVSVADASSSYDGLHWPA